MFASSPRSGVHPIDGDRLGNVLDPVLAHRLEAEGDLGLGVVVDGAGDADLARAGQLLQPRGDVDPIAVDVLVSTMTSPRLIPPKMMRWSSGRSPDARRRRSGLPRRIRPHRQRWRTRPARHRPSAVTTRPRSRRSWLDEVFAQRRQARMRPRLVGRHQAAVAYDVRSQDCGQPACHPSDPLRHLEPMIGTSAGRGQRQTRRSLRPRGAAGLSAFAPRSQEAPPLDPSASALAHRLRFDPPARRSNTPRRGTDLNRYSRTTGICDRKML